MRFMMIVKANADSEAGVLPTTELLTAMGKYNNELIKAGVLLEADGLHPSSNGVRIHYHADGKQTVVDGPFAESKELIAGFWLIQVKSRDEAIAWARRAPNPAGTGDSQIEVRQVFEATDFPNAPAGMVEQEQQLRESRRVRSTS